jgi:hypothetical protein
LHVDGDARTKAAVSFADGIVRHGVDHADGQEKKVEVSEDMPQPEQQGERDAQRIQRGLQVITKVRRIAEIEAGAMVVIGKPAQQWQ